MSTKLDLRAAVWAALIAGLVFMVVEMALVVMVAGDSPWGPPRMIGAIALGADALPPPATFDFGIVVVAMLIHFVISILFGIILGFIIARWRLGTLASIGVGAGFGLAVYLINFYGFTAVYPWFAMARTPITLVAHLIFGVVLGGTYHALAVRHFAQEAIPKPE